MKKAILLGANGYLGRHIAYFLQQQNIAFIPTDIAEKSIDNHSNYQKIDITKKEDLQKLEFNVDYVFVFAGLTGTSNAREDEEKFTKVNELGLKNIISCCQNTKGLRIIFPSTRLVYKGVENTPLSEDSEKETKSVYAKNKLNCEQLLEKSGIDYTIFRICVPYANLFDEHYSYGTIGFFINRAKANKNISIYGDGSLKRTFTHVADICIVIIKGSLLKDTKNNVYNIGSNDVLSLLEVANLVAAKYGVEVKYVDWPEEALKIESGDTIFEDVKLKKVLNYRYQHSLKEWIAEI